MQVPRPSRLQEMGRPSQCQSNGTDHARGNGPGCGKKPGPSPTGCLKQSRQVGGTEILRDNVALMQIATIYRSASGEGQELAEIVVEAFGYRCVGREVLVP